MDAFTAFLIFAVLVALETLAAQAWLAPYFRLGIPVFVQRRPLGPAASAHSRAEQLARWLEDQFRSRPQHPSIQFRRLPGAGPQVDLAFRERLFENRGGFKYLPVLHSAARIDPPGGEVRVTGWLNWYVLYTLGYLVYRSLEDRSFIIVAVLILFVLALSYAAQAGINAQVAETLAAAAGSAAGEEQDAV